MRRTHHDRGFRPDPYLVPTFDAGTKRSNCRGEGCGRGGGRDGHADQRESMENNNKTRGRGDGLKMPTRDSTSGRQQ